MRIKDVQLYKGGYESRFGGRPVYFQLQKISKKTKISK